MKAGKPQQPQHPLLTPSGRALAVGGKVLNVSVDSLAPCIMFWPDNEALPEPGQAGLANVHVRPCNKCLSTPVFANWMFLILLAYSSRPS
ncbi:hypothetical protein DFH11DRAFT_1866285 [Phellopilus nigrolimitatus]|nr:hypothetical protein DFH11DRAFT_1866285 [Phellopilus nigrolimitatus]